MSRGMVISMPDRRILTYPKQSMTYLTQHNRDAVNKNLTASGYTVYPARDGSIITLYTYRGQLSMSSCSFPDISCNKWNNDKTFAEMFMHSARMYPEFISGVNLTLCGETGLLSWNLTANIAVTFGMRNHNIHKLADDPECIWVVHAMDMNTRRVIELSKLKSLEKDTPLEGSHTVQELVKKAGQQSIDTALFARTSSRFNYGYILDSRAYRVFIPSMLYLHLRDTLYCKVVGVCNITPQNRYLYNIMYLSLCGKDQTLTNISKLIPEMSTIVESVNTFLKSICQEVKMYIQKPSVLCDIDDIIVTIGETVITNECDYKPSDHTKYDILPLYVYHPTHINDMFKMYLKRQ
jgi:hypothetical protein